jgi:hypothetical protein
LFGKRNLRDLANRRRGPRSLVDANGVAGGLELTRDGELVSLSFCPDAGLSASRRAQAL